jgi:anaerobic selenocysteine-containing dehydrogenase
MKAGGLWYLPVHTYKNWERLFKTPTGKFEFLSTRTERAFYDYALKVSEESARKNMGMAEKGDAVFMPHYEPAPSDVDRSEYPLVMMPYEMINLASAWTPNPPYLYKTLFDDQLKKDDSFAEINPKTASKYGLKDGDPAIIKSPAGTVRVRVNLFEGAMPGIVYLPLGFGHTAYDEFSVGKGINPNDIIHGGKDPLSGHPVWWNTPVQLIKV